MSALLLGVTGARALAFTAQARAWAVAQIAEVFEEHLPILLVHGGCPESPDEWAAYEASEHGCPCPTLVYHASGKLEAVDWTPRDTPSTWLLPDDVAGPLLRNTRMVEGIVRRKRAHGLDARMVAFTAPWSKSGGTHDTIRKARAAGLRVEVRDCPRGLGPGGAGC